MVLAAFKKYPGQISSTFRRFPVAVAFAFLSFVAIIVNTEFFSFLDAVQGSQPTHFLLWLGIYPIAALLISLATSLVQESLKSSKWQPQVITGGLWLVLSLLLCFSFTTTISWANYYFVATNTFVYIVAALSIFIAPFWKDKDENASWIFLFRNIKSIVVGALVTGVLLGSIEALVFGCGALFDHEFNDNVYLYIFYFCASVVFPVLYLTGIPSIEECREKTPELNKFATSTIRFLFMPVLSFAILLFYAYIVKFILLWDMPQGMVSGFVIAFMIYMLALITILYPARLSSGNVFEKKLLKIFPAACIPLVVMMTVGLIRRLSDYGISAERIYAIAINIYFYIIIAILLTDKVIRKSRYIVAIFCVMFFILTDTPLNAVKISHHVWMESIKSALVEAGYTDYPLNIGDSRAFIKELRKKGDASALLTISRMKEIASEPIDPEFAKYLSLAPYDDAFIDYLTDDACCGDDKNEEPFDRFEASIEYSSNTIIQVPRGMKGAVAIDHYFDNSEFEFTGDTLTFRVSLKEDSGCSCNSDTADACAEAPVPVYSFTVDRQTLKQDSTKQIKADKATIAINYLYAEEASKDSKSLRIRGILFTE